MAVNPLNKIPTLVLDDGMTLYGSAVICEYVDSLHDGPKLFPSDHAARWPALKRQALGDGLMELSILLFVVSIASNVHAMVHREEPKAAMRRAA